MQWKKTLSNQNFLIALAIVFAFLSGYSDSPYLLGGAKAVSEVFINLLKLLSIPILFLSIVSTVSGMENVSEFKSLGKRIVKYTLLTTVIASTIGLIVFLVIDPVQTPATGLPVAELEPSQKGYFDYLLQTIPSNFVKPFSENHVFGSLFLAIILSLAILALPEQNRTVLNQFFSSLFAAVMKITSWIVWWIPLGIWSFITLFIVEMRGGMEIQSIVLYLICVLTANLIQGFVVLPIFVKCKGVSPIKLLKGMLPALSLAFFTKSSSATLPMAMRCAEENVGIPRKMASFALPLCTTINMNACAAFILTTVLFVSMNHGVIFSPIELIMWIFVATVAAVGNAGVPMGCFFLSSALLAAMNVPLSILGIILPFYTLIDMLETALNVWSDSCVVAVVHKEAAAEKSTEQLNYVTN